MLVHLLIEPRGGFWRHSRNTRVQSLSTVRRYPVNISARPRRRLAGGTAGVRARYTSSRVQWERESAAA